MTNEEREKLCAWLRHLPSYLDTMGCDAANELERLANAEAVWKGRAEAYLKIANEEAALAQPDVERNIEKLEADGWHLPVNAAALDTGPSHADVEMARAKSYARGFQDGLKAARNSRPDPSPVLTQPEAEQIT